jgi:hypothetical protein
MYGEDIDLSYRITLGGYENWYFPDARIIHYKGESTKKSSVNYVFVFYNAMAIFAKKHFTRKRTDLFAAAHQRQHLPERGGGHRHALLAAGPCYPCWISGSLFLRRLAYPNALRRRTRSALDRVGTIARGSPQLGLLGSALTGAYDIPCEACSTSFEGAWC